MEDLKKLVDIITQRKQRQFPLLELKSVNENSSKENIFFRYIRKGIIQSDDDASRLIYGAKSDDDRYRMLKSRLKQKLLNHLFFLDFADNRTKATSAYEQECLEFLHQAKMLMFTDEYKIARSLIQKSLTTAQRCEFTRHAITCYEELLKLYSANNQPHLFEDTIGHLKNMRELQQLEEEAETHFYYKKMMIEKSVNSRKKNLDSTPESLKYLEDRWNVTKSFNVFQYLMQLTLLYKEMTGDYSGMISLLKEVETGRYKKKTLNTYRLEYHIIVYYMAFALYKNKEFDKCFAYTQNYLKLFDPSSNYWFLFRETYFLTALNLKKNRIAGEIISEVFENKSFQGLEPDQKDKWRIYDAYARFALDGNRGLEACYTDLLAQLPENSNGKEGYSMAILILQFLYFLDERQLSRLVLVRDEMKEYMANHFKENFSYRTRTFYKLLNIIVENDLNSAEILSKSRYLTNKMRENQIMENIYPELEIIPYEELWNSIVQNLERVEI